MANSGQKSLALLQLYKALDHFNVRVILWKGNDKDLKSPSGEGDVDLLVHTEGSSVVQDLLVERGFVRVPSCAWRHQPSVTDWFGADELSGQLLHIQLYERLVLGSAYSRQIIVPGAEQLFTTLNCQGISAPPPAESAVLFVCRAALARWYLPGSPAVKLLHEAHRLVDSPATLSLAASRLFDNVTANVIVDAYHSGSVRALWYRLRECYSPGPQAGGYGTLPWLLVGTALLNRRWLRWPLLTRRHVQRPAPIVCAIGFDSSDKFSVLQRLVTTLDRKIDARFVCFGTAQRQSSRLQRTLAGIGRLACRLHITSRYQPLGSAVEESMGLDNNVPRWLESIWTIAAAIERIGKMRQLQRYANAGILVVTDGYPQNQFADVLDAQRLGPRIKQSSAPVFSYFVRWEQRVYERLASHRPDLVLMLDDERSLAVRRTPETSSDHTKRNKEVADTLHCGNADRLIVDAGAPLNVVVGKCLRAVLHKINT